MRRILTNAQEVATVSGLVTRLWMNEFARQVGGSRRTSRIVVGAAFGGLLCWQVVGVLTKLSTSHRVIVSPELQRALWSEVLLACLAVPALLTTLCFVLAPARSQVDVLLRPLPLRRTARSLGTTGPIIGFATLASLLVLLPILMSSVTLLAADLAVPFIGLCLTGGLVGLTATFSLSRLSDWILGTRWNVPHTLTSVVAAIPIIGGAIFLVAMSPQIPWTGRTANALNWPIVLLCGLGASATFLAFAVRLQPEGGAGRAMATVPIFRRLAKEKAMYRTVLGLELVRWYRSPLVLSVDGLALLATLVLVLTLPTEWPSWPILTVGVVVATSSGSAFVARGLTRRHDWIWLTSPVDARPLLLSKLAAAVIVAALPLITSSFLLVAAGRSELLSIVGALPFAFFAFSASFFAGSALPVDESVGLSSLTTIALALALDAVVASGLSALNFGSLSSLAVLVVGLLLVALGLLNIRRLSLP